MARQNYSLISTKDFGMLVAIEESVKSVLILQQQKEVEKVESHDFVLFAEISWEDGNKSIATTLANIKQIGRDND